MSEIIFAEQTLNGFAIDESIGLYCWGISPHLFQLIEGESYTIAWDDSEYTSVAEAMTLGEVSGIGFGNPALVGIGENNDIPFIFAYIPDISYNACYTTSDQESHVVMITLLSQEDTEEQQGVDFVLYDRTGAAVTYKDKDYVTMDTPDGGLAKFSYGEVIEGTQISLNFEAGNQVLSIPKGYLIKEATIKKPDTLTPENIKKNITIAGVVGAFAGTEAEKTVELMMTDGDQVIEADEDTVMTKVTVRKPETLVPENIAKGIDIAGVVGNASVTDFDVTDEILKYFSYNIDSANKTITLYEIFYDKLYQDTGSYDVTVPDLLGDYSVIIAT